MRRDYRTDECDGAPIWVLEVHAEDGRSASVTLNAQPTPQEQEDAFSQMESDLS
jgi:hypothetical protein